MSVVERRPSPAVAKLEDCDESGQSASASRLPLAAPSPMLIELLTSLQSEAIPYCYWKSSLKVERALAGESDLDLLVGRNRRERAIDILRAHGFKLWPDTPGRDHPAVMSFLGYEESADAIRHVHVHFRLVVGHSLLKNYRLPVEERIISRSVLHPRIPIRVLDPADEALLLIIRKSLELRRTDPIALWSWPELRQKYADALGDVAKRVDADSLKQRASELFSGELANAIGEILGPSAARPSKTRLRAAIARELSAYRMYGGFEATARTAGRCALFVVGAINERFIGAPWAARRRAPGGGVLISFVGVDGSGKSTQVAEVRKWLGLEIDVLAYYFGSGDGRASLVFRPFKAVAGRIAARIRVKPKGASHGKISDRPPGPVYSTLFAIWALAVALDKRVKLIAAQRAIARGFVVVTDRYPQNEIAQFNDGPLLHRLERAPAWLSRLERSIYVTAQRAPPDLVIKLHVGPTTVTRREPDMSPEIVLQRIEWLKELKFPGARIESIDATRPLAEVKRLAKRAIWEIL
jgi:hypothetical protein